MILDKLTDMEKYRVHRYLYSIGNPIIDDTEFDKLERQVKATQSNSEATSLFTTTADDDAMPLEIFKKVCSEDELNFILGKSSEGTKTSGLDEYVSKSMVAYRTLDECYPWIRDHKSVEFCVSPKIDGTNTTSEYKSINGSVILNYSRTRGRSGRSIELTETARMILPTVIEKDNFVVSGEAVVSSADVETYNKVLGNIGDAELVTPRGVALSALRRTDIPREAKSLVKIKVFRTNFGDTHSEGLELARKLGFDIVPYEVYKFNFTTKEEYEEELTKLIWKYKSLCDEMGIVTDGIVLQINDNKYFSETVTNTAFDGGNLAVKALAWEAGIYTSVVEDIVMTSDEKYQYSCKAKVRPVYSSTGKKLTMVNIYNPDTMIKAGVKRGSKIEFEYKNETTIGFRKVIG